MSVGLRLALSEMVGVIAPSLCLGCGCETLWAADALCPDCHQALSRLSGVICSRCAQPSPCDPCPARGARWQVALAACRHGGIATELVAELKRSGARRVATAMAAEIAAAAPREFWESSALVPVAPHPSRRRASGVDHALELTEALGRVTGRPLIRVLRRLGPATRQAGSSYRERTEAGRLRFACRGPVPPRVVVVDDVHTTGTTLAAASLCLTANGADSIRVATFSRAVGNIASVPEPVGW